MYKDSYNKYLCYGKYNVFARTRPMYYIGANGVVEI